MRDLKFRSMLNGVNSLPSTHIQVSYIDLLAGGGQTSTTRQNALSIKETRGIAGDPINAVCIGKVNMVLRGNYSPDKVSFSYGHDDNVANYWQSPKFNVSSASYNYATDKTTVVGYDALHQFITKYEPLNILVPTTLQDILSALGTKFNVEVPQLPLNGDLQVSILNYDDTNTFLDVLNDIANLSCCIVQLDHSDTTNGRLRFTPIKQVNPLYRVGAGISTARDYKNRYKDSNITGVRFNSIAGVQGQDYLVGTNEVVWDIPRNGLVKDNAETVALAPSISNYIIGNIGYNDVDIKVPIGIYSYMEVGDTIEYDIKGTIYQTMLMEVSHEYTESIKTIASTNIGKLRPDIEDTFNTLSPTKRTEIKVDKVEQTVNLEVAHINENLNSLSSQIALSKDNILSTVEEKLNNMPSDEELENVLQKVTEVEQKADQLEINISNISVDEVTTKTGYTFNQDGLHIQKSGESIGSTLDNTGLEVRRGGNMLLQANHTGVNARDVTVRNYLEIEWGRFQKWQRADGKRALAVFWKGNN